MDQGSDRKASFTYEHGLWALVAGLALVMRLAQLGVAPLTAAEAREAMVAWRAATGEGMPLANYSPVLLAANSLLFTLLGTSDELARLLPALFGACLALTPVLFRRHLGRVGALASGFYLAVSPTGLVASRQLDGTVIAAAGAMLFLGGVLRFFESERRRWLTLAAVGLGLGVAAGAALYGVLLPLGLTYAILSRLRLDMRPLVPAHATSRIAGHGRQFVLTFTVAALLLATGLGWNIPGLGASGGLLAGWFGRFERVSDPVASPLALLTTYELWVVVFGLAGAAWTVQRRDTAGQVLGLWAGLEVVTLMLMPGRAPIDSLWAILPLAMLAGLFLEGLVKDRSSSDTGLRIVHLAIVLILWGHAYLMLARYASFGDRVDLALALVAVVLQGLVGLSFALMLGGRAAFQSSAVGTGIALLALTLGVGWGVAYGRPADPREILLSDPTPINVRDLVQTLEDISWRETGLSESLAFTYEAPQDSVLAWYLRDFSEARRMDELGGLTAAEMGAVAVTSARDEPMALSTDSDYAGNDYAENGYAGQDFALRRRWRLRDLGCRFWESECDAAEWFLFRDGVPLPEADRWATLWRVSDVSH